MAISEDTGNQPAAVHSTTLSATTASFSPQAGTLLVALLANDGSASGAVVATISDSASGSWTLLKRQNTANGVVGGSAVVWCRYLTTAPGSMTVTASWNVTNGTAAGNLVVRCLLGASPTQTGATAGNGGSSIAPTATLTPTVVGSRIYGAVLDYTTNATLTANAQSTIIDQFNDATNGDTWGTFKGASDTSALSSTTYGCSNANAAFNIAIAEILPDVANAPAPLPVLLAPDDPLGGMQPWMGAPDVTVSATIASAGTASMSFVAQSASTGLSALPGSGTLALAAIGPQTAVSSLPGTASVVFTAWDVPVGITAGAGVASVTVSAQAPVAGITALSGLAQITIAGQSPVSALGALPGTASVTTSVQQDTASVTALPGVATVSFSGLASSVSVTEGIIDLSVPAFLPDDPLGGMVPWTGAPGGVITNDAVVNAGVASMTVAAQNATAGLGIIAGTASMIQSAQSASTGLSASAGTSSIAFAARGPLAAVSSLPGTASVAFTARDSAVGISALPGTASTAITGQSAMTVLPQTGTPTVISGHEPYVQLYGRHPLASVAGSETGPVSGGQPLSSTSGNEPSTSVKGRES